ncbi:MAG: GAF domain-containing protein [Microscillaceae bacterium]|nr:GAF domain-containing protein [Microscillaceae bacterium]
MKWIEKITDFFKNQKLLNKFLIALSVVSISALAFISIFAYLKGKELLSKQSFTLLENHTDQRKKAIESYFIQVQKQIISLAHNPSTIESLQAFDSTFYQIRQTLNPEEEKVLRKFYELDFLKQLQYNLLDKTPEYPLFPRYELSKVLQYKYIAANPKPIGYKHLPYKLSQQEAYDLIHHKYHPSYLRYLKEFAYSDIFLVNDQGDIVYSVAKKTDFATNLINGPYRFSHLSRLLKKTLKSKERNFIGFEDFDFYLPNFNEPVCFASVPIYPDNHPQTKKIGALIIQLANENINNLMTNHENWEKDGLGASGETALVGPDFLIRNDTRRFIVDPVAYQTDLLNHQVDSNLVMMIQRLNTTILLRKVKNQSIINALNGKSGSIENYDFLGQKVLDIYRPVNVFNTQWAIITEMNSNEIFKEISNLRNQLFLASGLLVVLIVALGYFVANSLSLPMRRIQKEITMLAQGEFPQAIQKIHKDELGKIQEALNSLIDNMKNVANFAKDIGKGNFNHEFNAKGDNDILGNSLLQMRENLRKISEDEQKRSWVNTGISIFGEILRNNSDNLQKLSAFTISELVKYLKANQGALFIWDETHEKLKLISTYAYDKFKYMDKLIAPGEGLVGQAYLEKETIFLKEIPENYSDIGSGLGHASPRCILVVPIKLNTQIFGVIEIASFDLLQSYETNFVETVSEDLATTISAIKVNAETRKLLEESQLVAEQLRKQEEEMRRSFEELIRSQEEYTPVQSVQDSFEFDESIFDIEPEESIQNLKQLNEKIKETEIEKRIKNAIIRQKELLDKDSSHSQENGSPDS